MSLYFNNLYRVTDIQIDADQTIIKVRWNADHPLYKVHFQGHSVTPGACIIQSAVELAGSLAGCPLQLKNAKSVKFLAIIDPAVHPDTDFVFQMDRCGQEEMTAKVLLRNEDLIFAKLALCLKTQTSA